MLPNADSDRFPKTAAEALERKVRGEVDSARRHAVVLGLDDAGTEARAADAERRTREQFTQYVGADLTTEHGRCADAMRRFVIEFSEPLTWPPDEVETIMRASFADGRVHDDREQEWQIIGARKRGYPLWFHMTCVGLDGQPRTAGPETKAWHDRKAEIERRTREDMPKWREAIRDVFREKLPEIVKAIRDSTPPMLY